MFLDEFFGAMRQVIIAFAERQSPPIPQHDWIPFYDQLFTLLSKYADELKTGKVAQACQRLWSADAKMNGKVCQPLNISSNNLTVGVCFLIGLLLHGQ